MTEFSEGMRWTVYGKDGFIDKASMTLDDKDGEQLTGVVRFKQGFVALSALTGGALSDSVELGAAVKAAEAEALNPTNP